MQRIAQEKEMFEQIFRYCKVKSAKNVAGKGLRERERTHNDLCAEVENFWKIEM